MSCCISISYEKCNENEVELSNVEHGDGGGDDDDDARDHASVVARNVARS